jgi:exopolyphosphatase/guanosine-5'-triphosphate,3'-diphosphate pyrophosphatase
MLGRALYSAFGGDGGFSKQLSSLLRPGEDERAIAWGKAIRLAQRLSGGTEALLRRSSLALSERRIVLKVHPRYRELASGAVERRLGQLAKSLGRMPAIAFG